MAPGECPLYLSCAGPCVPSTLNCSAHTARCPSRTQLSSTWNGTLLLLMGPTTLWYMPTYSSMRAALLFMSPAHGKW